MSMLYAPSLPKGPHGGTLRIGPPEPTGRTRRENARIVPKFDTVGFYTHSAVIEAMDEPILDCKVVERWVEDGREMGCWWWLSDFEREHMR